MRMRRWFGVVLLVAIASVAVICANNVNYRHQQERVHEYQKHYCGQRLTDIGDALLAYARNNRGRFPAKLGEFYSGSHSAIPSPRCPARSDLVRSMSDQE